MKIIKYKTKEKLVISGGLKYRDFHSLDKQYLTLINLTI